jgi:uncharacterized membrane protein YeaQ/YmgE (transglycosylase-associated protein family)
MFAAPRASLASKWARFRAGSQRIRPFYENSNEPQRLFTCSKARLPIGEVNRRPTRSKESMGIISWVVVGLIAGLLARWIMLRTGPSALFITILVGIGGVVIGGFVARLLGGSGATGFNAWSIPRGNAGRDRVAGRLQLDRPSDSVGRAGACLSPSGRRAGGRCWGRRRMVGSRHDRWSGVGHPGRFGCPKYALNGRCLPHDSAGEDP